MDNCIHCDTPNPENWFYCRECGKRAAEPKWTTNSFMRGKVSSRTDIEISHTTVEESASKMGAGSMEQRLKKLGVNPL